jgi:hypothetical protein
MTTAQAIEQGALGDCCRLISSGYTQRPVLNYLMLDYPGLRLDQAAEIYQRGAECCAAAGALMSARRGYTPSAADFPKLPGA